MKDRDGNTLYPGDKYRWLVNGEVFKVIQICHGTLGFRSLKTNKLASLKVQTRTLAQMERVR